MSDQPKEASVPDSEENSARFGTLEGGDTQWYLSPRARLWLEETAKEEGRNPGRVLSELIEGYLNLEKDHGRDSVVRMLERLVHGPREAIARAEEERLKWEEMREKAEDLVDAAKIFTAQIVAERTIEETGEPRYRLKESEKEILFGEGDPEIR